MRRVEFKAGKLLRIDAEADGGSISAVKLHGDFFIHPEDGIEIIEKACIGEIDSALARINKAFDGLEVVGFTAADLYEALKKFK